MKLLVTPCGETESFEVEVKRHYGRGSIYQYGVKHKDFKAFQFDDYYRPNDYVKEVRHTKAFHGFLIGKKGKQHVECYIKVIEDETEGNTTT
jgi:hypothetical protein